MAAVINPANFHYEVCGLLRSELVVSTLDVVSCWNLPWTSMQVVFSVVQCLADLNRGGRSLEVDMYMSVASTVRNNMGILDVLTALDVPISYPK